MPSPTLAAAALGGALLDRLLGEPQRCHPLVGFGRLADGAERLLRRGAPGHAVGNRLRGLVAWVLIVVPFVVLAAAVPGGMAGVAIDALLLWFALGARALGEHAKAVALPLAAGDLDEAPARRLDGVPETAALDEGASPRRLSNRCWRTATTPSSARCSGSSSPAAPARCCSVSPTRSMRCGATATSAASISAGPRRASTTCSTSCRRG
jgi:hypothetical protein